MPIRPVVLVIHFKVNYLVTFRVFRKFFLCPEEKFPKNYPVLGFQHCHLGPTTRSAGTPIWYIPTRQKICDFIRGITSAVRSVYRRSTPDLRYGNAKDRKVFFSTPQNVRLHRTIYKIILFLLIDHNTTHFIRTLWDMVDTCLPTAVVHSCLK